MNQFRYLISRIFRRLTAFRRRLPDFIIIGTSKGGTTSLFQYLSEHPGLILSSRKEVQYYGTNYSKGLNWYKSHFPLLNTKKNYLTGEATPYYLFYPLSPQLIKEENPSAKFIVMLRNPVERAYSHYQMQVRNGHEKSADFNEAINKEPERLKGEYEKIMQNANYSSKNHLRFAYLERGKYGDQLECWFKYFPRDQFLILNSELFFEKPEMELKKVYDFLGIDTIMPSNLKPFNVGKYDAIHPELRNQLQAYFQTDQNKLSGILQL